MTGKACLPFLAILFLQTAGCVAMPSVTKAASEKPGESPEKKPEIIEVFACGDYCPGPREQYLVKAYKGVTTREECRRVGGRPYEYFGWGKHFLCLAE